MGTARYLPTSPVVLFEARLLRLHFAMRSGFTLLFLFLGIIVWVAYGKGRRFPRASGDRSIARRALEIAGSNHETPPPLPLRPPPRLPPHPPPSDQLTQAKKSRSGLGGLLRGYVGGRRIFYVGEYPIEPEGLEALWAKYNSKISVSYLMVSPWSIIQPLLRRF